MSDKAELERRNAVEWVSKRALAALWCGQDRADCLLWLAAKCGVDIKNIVLAACACARLTLPYIQGEEKEDLIFKLGIMEDWCRNEALEEENSTAKEGVEQIKYWAILTVEAASQTVGLRATADAVRSAITAEMIEQAWRKK